jgi:hypothetical protein
MMWLTTVITDPGQQRFGLYMCAGKFVDQETSLERGCTTDAQAAIVSQD